MTPVLGATTHACPRGPTRGPTIATANDQICRTITLPLVQGRSTAGAGMGMRVRLITVAVAAVSAVLAFAAAVAPAAQASQTWTTPLGQSVRFCGMSGKPFYMGVSAGTSTSCSYGKAVAHAVLSHRNQRYVTVGGTLLRVRYIDSEDSPYLQAASKSGKLVLVTS